MAGRCFTTQQLLAPLGTADETGCEPTMASLDKIQLMLDWHHDMVRSGKKVGQTFNMDMVDAYYRQVADRGSPLLPFQERKLDKIIMSFHDECVG